MIMEDEDELDSDSFTGDDSEEDGDQFLDDEDEDTY
jgi:hypothetical protein